MLIYFEAENFRSIREEICLQMTAVNYYKELQDNLITWDLPGLKNLKYVKAAAIYGPNAAGKSSVWQALLRMKDMVCNSVRYSPEQLLPYHPFRLDTFSKNKPTRFSIVFTAGKSNTRFQYSFSYNEKTIISEKLYAYPKGFKQVWFSRELVEDKPQIKDSTYLKIPASLKPLLNNGTLLLSLLGQYPSAQENKEILSIVNWFARDLDLYSSSSEAYNDFPYAGEVLDGEKGSDAMRKYIRRLLTTADVGIVNMQIKTQEIPKDMQKTITHLFGVPQEQLEEGAKTIVFEHKGSEGDGIFDFGEESNGTKQLFGLSAHIAQALETGGVLFVDELDASLHPLLVAEIIRTFTNEKTNLKAAQLVFTLHNVSILEDELLRRDQIWFVEKNAAGATELYALSDFSPRKNETVAAGYLGGRYAAIPVISECFGMNNPIVKGDWIEQPVS